MKTKFCKFFPRGSCAKGASCVYAHSRVELKPITNFFRTKLCPKLIQHGHCESRDECRFAHAKEELRKVGMRKKRPARTKLCESKKTPLPELIQNQSEQECVMQVALASTAQSQAAVPGMVYSLTIENTEKVLAGILGNAAGETGTIVSLGCQSIRSDETRFSSSSHDSADSRESGDSAPPCFKDDDEDQVAEDTGADCKGAISVPYLSSAHIPFKVKNTFLAFHVFDEEDIRPMVLRKVRSESNIISNMDKWISLKMTLVCDVVASN